MAWPGGNTKILPFSKIGTYWAQNNDNDNKFPVIVAQAVYSLCGYLSCDLYYITTLVIPGPGLPHSPVSCSSPTLSSFPPPLLLYCFPFLPSSYPPLPILSVPGSLVKFKSQCDIRQALILEALWRVTWTYSHIGTVVVHVAAKLHLLLLLHRLIEYWEGKRGSSSQCLYW